MRLCVLREFKRIAGLTASCALFLWPWILPEHASGQTNPNDPQLLSVSATPAAPNRVSIKVAFHDKKDRPLTDLKAGDIAINDAGRAVDSREVSITDDAASGDHVITFLFDQLDFAGAKNAARAARNILKNLGAGSSEFGVWAVDGGLRVVQPYTSDRNQVEIAISEATGDPKSLASTAAATAKLLLAAENAGDADVRGLKQKRLDRSALEALNEAQRVVNDQHAPWGIASLMAAAPAQRPLDGRKAIIFFTQTVPTDLNAADMLRTASRKLRDASTSVFVVDLNALDTGAAEGMAASIAMGGMASANHLNPTPVLNGPATGYQPLVTGSEAKQITDTIIDIEIEGTTSDANLLAQLADSTGGAYSDVDESVKKICRHLTGDLDHYYTIRYAEPDHLDGRFHPVAVKVLRPGLKVIARAGYFGTAVSGGAAEHLDTSSSSNEDLSSSLAAISEGAVASDLTFHAAILRLGDAAAGLHGVVAVEVPIEELDLREDPNTKLFSLHATVAAELKGADGKTVARFHEEFRRHGSMDTADKLRAGFLGMERSANLPAGDYQFDAVVRDWNSDKIGNVTQAVHLAATEDASVLSDLVLVRSTEETRGADTSPLPYGQDHIVPNLSGELPGASKQASLYFQLYPDAKKPGNEKAELHLEVSKNGKLLASLPMRMEAVQAHERSSRVANVKLGRGGGAYDLTLCLKRGGQTIKRHVSVVSAGADEPASDSQDSPEQLAKFEPPSIDLDLKTSTRTLTPAESGALLSAARERALAYTHSLPNFMCVEKIDRTVDAKGTGVWKHRDSMAEMVRYVDESETRTMLEVNGEKSHLATDRIQGAPSNGEFGGILQIIFDPASSADFQWVKTEEKEGQLLQAFSYRVDAKNSQFFLTDHNGSRIRAPFHGIVLVDNDTRSVRRLIAHTDVLPRDFGIRASWMTIDYDYIAINGHDYLLPTSGEVGLKQGRSEAVSNELKFSNYRRFGSQVRILGNGPIGANPSP